MARILVRRCAAVLGHFRAPALVEARCFSGMDPQTTSGILSQRVQVNDVRLHYEITGTGDHTVLLLPGALGCSTTDFRPQLTDLDKDQFTIICWDPRGFGKSIPPERDWPLMFYHRDAEDAVTLMKTIGKDRFSMLGFSDGGNTAMIIASKYPELIKKMVVWGSNAYVTKTDTVLFESLRNIDSWSGKMRAPFVDVYGEKYFRTQWSNWVTAFNRFYHENEGNIFKEDLPNIKCPTLVIHGEKDPLVMTEHPQYIHEHIKGSKLVMMPEAKHNLHLRFADQFNFMVTKFLTE